MSGLLPQGVAQTTGGAFNRKDNFKYFVAGSPTRVASEEKYDKGGDFGIDLVKAPNVLCAVNEIVSAKDFDLLDRMCDEQNVLLDSGIFNLANSHAKRNGVSHDVALSLAPEEIDGFSELWDRYGEVATRFSDRLWGVIELDQGGVRNKPRTRARIEQEFGIVPMPVYHPLLDGWDYYDTVVKAYDRICFGNLVQASPPVRLRLIHAASERARAYPYLWTHLLGVTPNENVVACPLRGSCDSSSWITSERWMPSWKAFSMLKGVSDWPTTMWYEQGGHRRAAAMNAINAVATTHILDAMQEDTHPWLSPSPA